MTFSFDENIFFWVWWLCTLVICVHQLVYSFRSRLGILGFVPVACLVFGYFYVLQSAIVVSNISRVSPQILANAQLLALLCLIGVILGWYKGVGKLELPPETPDQPYGHQSLWYGGLTACVIGLIGMYTFIATGFDWTASAYWYLLFHIVYPGLAICVNLSSRDIVYRQAGPVLVLMLISGLLMAPTILWVRRGPTYSFIVVVMYSFYVARPRRVNRGIILGGLGTAGVLMLLFVTIRDYTQQGTAWSETRVRELDAVTVLVGKAYNEGDNEFLYCSCIIATCQELQRYQFGTSYLSLLSHWIPRQWWPEKPALGQGWLEPISRDEVYAVTGVRMSRGATYSGIGEAFQDFAWFTPLFWFALSWCIGLLFRAAMTHRYSVAPIMYVGVLACSHYLFSQGFAAAFVPGLCYVITPVLVYLSAGQLYRRVDPKRPTRRKTERKPLYA